MNCLELPRLQSGASPGSENKLNRVLGYVRLKVVVTYLWLVGNGRMVVIVVIIVPHSSIPY